MRNWFNTLNEALAAGGVLHKVPMITEHVPYNSQLRIAHDGLFVAVERDSRGMYERAISYKTAIKENFVYCAK